MSSLPRHRGGRAFVFGDDIDTDALAPGLYMKRPIAELAAHCLETVDPDFAKSVKPGDVVVAGDNFGMGSSREQAIEALKALGVIGIVARSFARIFYRNALNLGLTLLIARDAGTIRAGDLLVLDPGAGRIENRTQANVLEAEPLPPHLLAMMADGGLLAHLEKRLRAR